MVEMISNTVITSNIMIEKRKLRELLKKTDSRFISVKKASQILNTDKKHTLEILSFLDDAGYIEKTNFDGLWQQTLRGKILAYSKSKKQFRVETLKNQLNNLIKRINIVGQSLEYPSYISEAIIISEYPIEYKSEGIHITYSLKSKGWHEMERNKAEDKLRERHKGNFNNIVEYYFYPNEAIRLFLKSRSPVLKLKEYSSEKMQEISGHRLI
jgi:hypothetical protein